MFSKSSLFGDFMCTIWLMLKGRKRSCSLRLGWQYRAITSLSPINEPFLSFNTNQKPCINSPKVGILRTKTVLVSKFWRINYCGIWNYKRDCKQFIYKEYEFSHKWRRILWVSHLKYYYGKVSVGVSRHSICYPLKR